MLHLDKALGFTYTLEDIAKHVHICTNPKVVQQQTW